MWIVIFGRHWLYHKHEELRFESRHRLVAFVVYQWWSLRYLLTVYPVKYLKMYKSSDVIRLDSYVVSKSGDYERLKKRSRYNPSGL